ncbi:hypothetical protein HAX54_031432, partial [Datura stramonium]|nr:hypothetical protein [Datura stramonium]
WQSVKCKSSAVHKQITGQNEGHLRLELQNAEFWDFSLSQGSSGAPHPPSRQGVE